MSFLSWLLKYPRILFYFIICSISFLFCCCRLQLFYLLLFDYSRDGAVFGGSDFDHLLDDFRIIAFSIKVHRLSLVERVLRARQHRWWEEKCALLGHLREERAFLNRIDVDLPSQVLLQLELVTHVQKFVLLCFQDVLHDVEEGVLPEVNETI